jgi:hypothetical protein
LNKKRFITKTQKDKKYRRKISFYVFCHFVNFVGAFFRKACLEGACLGKPAAMQVQLQPCVAAGDLRIFALLRTSC